MEGHKGDQGLQSVVYKVRLREMELLGLEKKKVEVAVRAPIIAP